MQHVTILARYLRAEAHGGRLRLERPEIHADAFVGALSHYVFWETVLGHRIASHNVYIRMLVSNMLRAALQPAGAIAQSKRRTDRNSTVEGQASGPLQ
jgi:hypothetical protein